MKVISFLFSFALLFLLISNPAVSQQRCGTAERDIILRSQGVIQKNIRGFEQWLSSRQRNQRDLARTENDTYKIPVVVHVIHNGEAVGTGSNIPVEQIMSQLQVLNEDFQRQNADSTDTPEIFHSLAGSMNIEFMLAKRDPNGLATSGIVRVNGGRAEWFMSDEGYMKSLSYWPSQDYLNIWVCNLKVFLGYGQFPISDLPGLEGSPENEFTDGVVIAHNAFGSSLHGNFNLDPDYDRGRTATHEISHFFGLRHIWGDASDCSGSDFVDDTPNQDDYTSGCPAHPRTTCTPGVVKMFQNFLDYTDDRCMNLFTIGQVNRMITVLENSPRRVSLLSSNALLPPEPVDNDLGISKVLSPAFSQCSANISPSIRVKNYGKNFISAAQVRIRLGSVILETKNLSLSLAPGDSATVAFDDFTANVGANELIFEILETNNTEDGDGVGNANYVSNVLLVPAQKEAPFFENFSAITNDWTIVNAGDGLSWEITLVPDGPTQNETLGLRFADEVVPSGSQKILFTPVFDLSSSDNSVVHFRMAQASAGNNSFKVVAFKNCRAVEEGSVLFEEKTELELSSETLVPYFIPNSTSNWRNLSLDLNDFNGEDAVQLAFIATNTSGNNLYLDNIVLAANNVSDASLRIVNPGPVSCTVNSVPKIEIMNTGATTTNNATIMYQVDALPPQTISFDNLDIPPGESQVIELPEFQAGTGEHQLYTTLVTSNGMADAFEANNMQITSFTINDASDVVPLRMKMQENSVEPWTIVNPRGGMNWQILPGDNNDGMLYFNAYNNPVMGDESWFVSPALNFSRAADPTLTFDLSYRPGYRVDDLKILASRNCGASYEPVSFTIPDPGAYTDGEWVPASSADWTKMTVDLSTFSREDDVRIAFVATNALGNSMYLDNIEFFMRETDDDLETDELFTVYGYDMADMANSKLKIKFHLVEKQNVQCDVVDLMGRIVATATFYDVLNQSYDLPESPGMGTGMYVVRLKISGASHSKRIAFTR